MAKDQPSNQQDKPFLTDVKALPASGVVAAPGAFNALCARAIERAGFGAVYVSGAGLSNAVYGIPDVGLTTDAMAKARHEYLAAGADPSHLRYGWVRTEV